MNEHEINLEHEKTLVLIKQQVKIHETRINNHSNRLDVLEKNESRNDEKIQNLIDKMDSFISTMRWVMGLLIGSFVSFFFYAAQHGLIK